MLIPASASQDRPYPVLAPARHGSTCLSHLNLATRPEMLPTIFEMTPGFALPPKTNQKVSSNVPLRARCSTQLESIVDSQCSVLHALLDQQTTTMTALASLLQAQHTSTCLMMERTQSTFDAMMERSNEIHHEMMHMLVDALYARRQAAAPSIPYYSPPPPPASYLHSPPSSLSCAFLSPAPATISPPPMHFPPLPLVSTHGHSSLAPSTTMAAMLPPGVSAPPLLPFDYASATNSFAPPPRVASPPHFIPAPSPDFHPAAAISTNPFSPLPTIPCPKYPRIKRFLLFFSHFLSDLFPDHPT